MQVEEQAGAMRGCPGWSSRQLGPTRLCCDGANKSGAKRSASRCGACTTAGRQRRSCCPLKKPPSLCKSTQAVAKHQRKLKDLHRRLVTPFFFLALPCLPVTLPEGPSVPVVMGSWIEIAGTCHPGCFPHPKPQQITLAKQGFP